MNNRILITGTHSGCGKTTVVCALLAALKNRGLRLSAFKCGPDYIDPMFHRRAVGVPSHNLDPFFCTSEQLKEKITAYGGEISLLEGAMGYYDGVGPKGCYSAYDVARNTQTPVVLVVDVRGMYASVGAVLKGFSSYKPGHGIRGVIFNNASPMLYEGLSSLARQSGLTPLGFLPREGQVTIESRHLGLVTANEIAGLDEKLTLLGALAERYIDLDTLLALAANAPALDTSPPSIRPLGSARLAVARDEAFCFLYEENLTLLRALGCEILFFSPLRDQSLPAGAAGLYLCGGYPELYLKALSANKPMLEAIGTAIQAGMPAIAECGGFLYLHRMLDTACLAGVIPATAYKAEKLNRFGYVTLRAQRDNLLCAAGESIRAHEFHYYESTDCGDGFIAEKPLSIRSWPCVHATETLYAGFPHLYLEANPAVAKNFVKKVVRYAAASSAQTD